MLWVFFSDFQVYQIKLLGENVVVANSYESIREVLVERSKDFAGRPSIFRMDFMNYFKVVSSLLSPPYCGWLIVTSKTETFSTLPALRCEPTGNRWIPLTKGVCRADILLLAWKSYWTNNRGTRVKTPWLWRHYNDLSAIVTPMDWSYESGC